ncbi:MAG: geranylgeranyl reductase [Thermoplasmata archaeon M11B2D]|nr:MAG: geranylgeranyl reductase [Thermoplasmata archaeon M11B2D]PNX53862.1 MAG: geranylgeranyl reductase [Thermoplasmata archaeon M9B2D]
MKYDAVIVGSGPAGSVTARFAAEAGAKVLMIERRAEVGVPILCGEGISQKVDHFKVLEGKRWIATKMNGARIFSPNGTKVTLAAEYAGNETGYVVYRDIFDQELARGAVKKGAELMLNTCALNLLKQDGKIKGITAQHFDETFEIEADIVVGADGVESRVGKWAGIQTTLKPHDLETCVQYTLSNIDWDSPYCDFFLGSKVAPGGYVWVFPKGKDVANVGIGVLASLSDSGKAVRLLDTFIAARPELKKGQPLRVLTGADPVAEPIQSVKDNLLLVGDAARQVDPITGGGLMHAIEAGKYAGETIGKAVEAQRFDAQILLDYEARWKSAFGKKLHRNYVVKEILLDMEDKTLDMLADSLREYRFEEFSTLSIIKALVTKHPSLLVKLTPLMKLARA